jgi:hypothetical protein
MPDLHLCRPGSKVATGNPVQLYPWATDREPRVLQHASSDGGGCVGIQNNTKGILLGIGAIERKNKMEESKMKMIELLEQSLVALEGYSGRDSYELKFLKKELEKLKKSPTTKEFKVPVEKRLYCTGFVTVTTASSRVYTQEDAVETVTRMIDSGELQTSNVEWSEPVYEETTFQVMEE